MFQTAHSPRWRRVVSAVGSPKTILLPPNMTNILKFGPDPNAETTLLHLGECAVWNITCYMRRSIPFGKVSTSGVAVAT